MSTASIQISAALPPAYLHWQLHEPNPEKQSRNQRQVGVMISGVSGGQLKHTSDEATPDKAR